MGRKNTAKGKEKRLARKEEQQRLSQAKNVVDKANGLADPLAPFPVFRSFHKNSLEAELSVQRSTALDEATREWAFSLTKRNMQAKYEQCSWGWSDMKKRDELSDDAAWYLIARGKDATPLGFSHFRFDIDEGLEVLYCYELQLESGIFRRGLGKFMMQILELIAFTNNMRKVVLTVLKVNHYSGFFKAINYQLDESSPVEDDDDNFPYEILSKVNMKLGVPSAPSTAKSLHVHGHCCPGHHHH